VGGGSYQQPTIAQLLAELFFTSSVPLVERGKLKFLGPIHEKRPLLVCSGQAARGMVDAPLVMLDQIGSGWINRPSCV
jgi:hypothetical protein